MTCRRTRIARIVSRGMLSAVIGWCLGCLSTEKKQDPLTKLNPDLRAKLGTLPKPQTNTTPIVPAQFDPSMTGGTGISLQNSFGRVKPTDSTSTKGSYAATTPPSGRNLSPSISAPTQPSVTYAAGSTEPARTSNPPRGTMPVVQPVQPTVASGPLPAPKLDPPAPDHPVSRANYESAAPISPVMLSTPMRESEPPGSVAAPIPPPPPPMAVTPPSSPPAPLPIPIPAPQVAPVPPPPAASGGELPVIPSATDGPIRGAQPPPVRIPPAPPIRPL
jgi:hypothetical protein